MKYIKNMIKARQRYMYKLLIIEDDKGIADAIKTHAQSWDLQVH